MQLVAAVLNALRTAIKALGRRPAFALFSVASLAIGVGATTTMFAIIDAADLRQLPYADPGRIVSLGPYRPPNGYAMTPPALFATERRSRAFSVVSGYRFRDFTLTGGSQAQSVVGYEVTPDFFSLLGVQPFIGRVVASPDVASNANPVVVLSYHFWRDTLDADRGVLGHQLRLWDSRGPARSYTIIGVMPEAFDMPPYSSVWVARSGSVGSDTSNGLFVVARLAPGVSVGGATTAAQRALVQAGESAPSLRGLRMAVRTLQGVRQHAIGASRARFLLLILAAIVSALACSNAVLLFLARISNARKDVATRLALGATRATLVVTYGLEPLVLGALAGALGLVLSAWTMQAATVGLGIFDPALEPHLDVRVALFAAALGLGTGLVVALAGTLRIGLGDLAYRLSGRGHVAHSGHRARWAFFTPVLVQLVGAVVLGGAAALLGGSLWSLEHRDFGFRPEGLVFISPPSIGAGAGHAASPDAIRGELDAELPALGATSGVSAVAAHGFVQRDYALPGAGGSLDGQHLAGEVSITPDYFSVLGAHLLSGRAFTASDTRGAALVGVVNIAAAKKLWPGMSPIGQRISAGDSAGDREAITIVGVVGPSYYEDADTARPLLYRPFDQLPVADRSLVVRLRRYGPLELATLWRQVQRVYRVQEVPRQAVLRTGEEWQAAGSAPERFTTILVTMSFAFAALLVGLGVFGIVSFTVAGRTHEIGVRIAMGAQTREILSTVLGFVIALGAAGIALGLMCLVLVRHLIQWSLGTPDVAAPLFVALAVLTMAAVLCVAALIPARRALAINPVIALRSE